ncbi:GNAT family N-acetyltransferase [Oceaniglobus indicus]|uniref:GNAT family N-acetyltransferase n=1 Tax=Oceaniglobus indicus TaxID=2047749 RepID=UPI000C176435|nr:GNAT family N-acetyltransferase [Oceaniglobus indicus]
MSVTLTLAGANDLDRLLALVTVAHPEITKPDALRKAVAPLVEGTPHGAAYLIGPPRAPVGYLILAFGYAVQRGGIEARVTDIFIRSGVRKRGMGSDAITALAGALAPHGVRAIGIEFDIDTPGAAALGRRAGMRGVDGSRVMTRKL